MKESFSGKESEKLIRVLAMSIYLKKDKYSLFYMEIF